jgi:hypothetical protein
MKPQSTSNSYLNRRGFPQKVTKEFEASPVTGEMVRLVDGRFGPYVTDGKTNARLPKEMSPESVTFNGALELLDAKSLKKSLRRDADLAKHQRQSAEKESSNECPRELHPLRYDFGKKNEITFDALEFWKFAEATWVPVKETPDGNPVFVRKKTLSDSDNEVYHGPKAKFAPCTFDVDKKFSLGEPIPNFGWRCGGKEFYGMRPEAHALAELLYKSGGDSRNSRSMEAEKVIRKLYDPEYKDDRKYEAYNTYDQRWDEPRPKDEWQWKVIGGSKREKDYIRSAQNKFNKFCSDNGIKHCIRIRTFEAKRYHNKNTGEYRRKAKIVVTLHLDQAAKTRRQARQPLGAKAVQRENII